MNEIIKTEMDMYEMETAMSESEINAMLIDMAKIQGEE